MKETIIRCDMCGEEIIPPEEPVVIRPMEQRKKQVGCDIVLTPRHKRMYAMGGKAMIRVNASFYCGVSPSGVEEMEFHSECLDREVRRRVVEFYGG